MRIKSGKISLFDNRYSRSELSRLLSRLNLKPVLETPTYRFFSYFYKTLGFERLGDQRFKDLVIARIVYPGSKAATHYYLKTKFGRSYSLTAIYRCMFKVFEKKYQSFLQDCVFKFSTSNFSSIIRILFFDLTTLYYETFDEDDFRKPGFSKDNKANQPQIIVALTVTAYGLPLQLKVFEGNKFEGHTMIPCISEITKKYSLDNLVVVADAAMLSRSNMDELEERGISFIVGARLGNIAKPLFEKVVSVPKTEGSIQPFVIGKDRILVVSYSSKRAAKDKSDREKQLRKARFILMRQDSITRRYKFLKKDRGNLFVINEENVKKAISLEGLKGYITNAVNLSNEEVVQKYSELWQVENSFRISKSDLKARPIFHSLREKIEAHLSIVFAGLAITRYVESVSGKSIKQILRLLDEAKEIVVEDPISGESVSKYTTVGEETIKILKLAKINLG